MSETDYKVGVLKATDKERMVWADDPYEGEATEPSQSYNYQVFEGVVTIDGQIHRWKAYSAVRWEGSSDGEYRVDYGYNVRVTTLKQWRKRQDAKAIRTAVLKATTEETERLNAEEKEEQSQ
jgi:hypothetical protein